MDDEINLKVVSNAKTIIIHLNFLLKCGIIPISKIRNDIFLSYL